MATPTPWLWNAGHLSRRSFFLAFFFHYSKGGQDISLPQGWGSELLVTELRGVDHKEQESHVA